MEWTTEQSNEIDLILSMQGSLTDISTETFEEICQFFLSSIYVKSEKLFTDLVRNIMAWSVFHPQKIYLYSDLLNFLDKNDEYVHKISSNIIISTVVHLMFKNKYAPLEPPPLHVLMQCYLKGTVSAGDIVKNLEVCFVEKKSAKTILSAYFLFFAPEVEEINNSLYHEFIQFIEINKFDPQGKSNHEIVANLDFFQNNKWEKLRAYRSHIHCMNPMLKMLVEDDVEELRKMNAHPLFSVDQRLEKNPPLSPFYFINDKPSLICAAAALNAVKCFKFLLLMNASLSQLSDSHQGAAAYAAMSGNLEILRIVEQNGCDFSGTLQMSVTFHNNDMFYWLHESKFPDLLQPSPENKSVLGQIGSSNNATILMYCIEQGLDINRVDENNECMLERAAYFGCNDVVKIALMLPNVDVNLKTRSPPMCAAAFNGNVELTKMFMEKPGTDPNIINDKGQMPIGLAAASAHFSTFEYLLNLPGITINLDKGRNNTLANIFLQNDYRIFEAFLGKYAAAKQPERLNYVNYTFESRTALHFACLFGYIDMVKYLISQPGIEINPVILKNIETPLDVAFRNYQIGIAKLLINSTNAVSKKAKDLQLKLAGNEKNQLRGIQLELLTLLNNYLETKCTKNAKTSHRIENPEKTNQSIHNKQMAENNGQFQLFDQQEYANIQQMMLDDDNDNDNDDDNDRNDE